MIEACHGCDVLFAGHVGFDRVASAGDVLGGALIGCRLHIRYSRVVASEIPSERDARGQWLYDEWRKLDDWVDTQRRETGLDRR